MLNVYFLIKFFDAICHSKLLNITNWKKNNNEYDLFKYGTRRRLRIGVEMPNYNMLITYIPFINKNSSVSIKVTPFATYLKLEITLFTS